MPGKRETFGNRRVAAAKAALAAKDAKDAAILADVKIEAERAIAQAADIKATIAALQKEAERAARNKGTGGRRKNTARKTRRKTRRRN